MTSGVLISAQSIKTMKPAIIITSGLSGSGKTVALRALEDAGFFCVDNLPATLINLFIRELARKKGIDKIAVGIDIREKAFFPKIKSVISQLRKKYKTHILFLEAEKDVLIRRFKETRRPHPLYSSTGDLEKLISSEKKLIMPLRYLADRIIDTSSYSPHQLRSLIASSYSSMPRNKAMLTTIISFGFKFGIPQNIDLLFDVRFIPNPYFTAELKDLTGIDPKVKKFIFSKKQTMDFLKKLKELLSILMPFYLNEGRTYLAIGIGCTGGKHRSPAIAEEIKKSIQSDRIDVNVIHREL